MILNSLGELALLKPEGRIAQQDLEISDLLKEGKLLSKSDLSSEIEKNRSLSLIIGQLFSPSFSTVLNFHSKKKTTKALDELVFADPQAAYEVIHEFLKNEVAIEMMLLNIVQKLYPDTENRNELARELINALKTGDKEAVEKLWNRR